MDPTSATPNLDGTVTQILSFSNSNVVQQSERCSTP